MECFLDLKRRARFHLAEGWLGMTREPDSLNPSATTITWTPPGEDKAVNVRFAQVIESVVSRWCGPDVDLVLIVPDGLGPGPREEILSQLNRHFNSIQFVPRTISAALAWCERNTNPGSAAAADTSRGARIGSLLVTTTPADTWEAALVPIRREGHGLNSRLCPVHERTSHRSELGVVGLEQIPLPGSVDDPNIDRAWWQAVLQDPASADRVARDPRRAAEGASLFRSRSLPGLLEERWKPTDASTDVHHAIAEATNHGQLISWLHVGWSENGVVPSELARIAESRGKPDHVMSPSELLPVALDVPRQVQRGEVPYYEALAQIDMYVEARNAFHDPVGSWRPLIEATEVPVGQPYHSPEPVSDLALPPGRKPSIDVFVRSHRRGQDVYGTTTATQRDPQSEPDPLHIEATLLPGQGLARIELRSQSNRGFQLSVREADLRPADSAPEVRYGWPPGSAWVVSHPLLADAAWRVIERAVDRGLPAGSLDEVRDTMNTWQLPGQLSVQVTSIDAPEEIHPEFIYLGVFPSGDGSTVPEVDRWAHLYGEELVSALRGAQDYRLKKKVLFNASWLYRRCPDEILDRVRLQLTDLSQLNEAALACAGNCFSRADDYRLFFAALLQSIRQRLPPANQYWIRAYRNMARFRVHALATEVLTPEEQMEILRWYLAVFEESMPNPTGRDFLHCVYLAPHILKRRRFDPEFILKHSPIYSDVRSVYERAVDSANSTKHRNNMRCALEFLSTAATTATLQRLGEGDRS